MAGGREKGVSVDAKPQVDSPSSKLVPTVRLATDATKGVDTEIMPRITGFFKF